MSTYLLLRDNKQSGPYSLSEMQTKGFKKYDLVWVEGKSAAWRYPGEITELKPFAPVIEEQPFDRFFKKPTEEIKEKNNLASDYTRVETKQSQVENHAIVQRGEKKVYASLPAKKNVTNTSTNFPTQTILISPSIEQKETKRPEPKPVVQPYFSETEMPYQQEEVFIAPAGKYARKKNQSDYKRFLQPLAVAACIVALLGAGIFIGMSISKNSSAGATNDLSEKQVPKTEKQDPQNVLIPTSNPLPIDKKATDENKQNDPLSNADNTTASAIKKSDEAKNGIASNTKKSNQVKYAAVPEPTKIAAQPENIVDSNADGSAVRKSVRRSDAINDKELVKNSVANLVSVSANKYSVGAFGGISELQLTVNNKSTYPLDLVMVEVQYVQSNKKIYKTENLFYKNVRPGEAMMQEAPKSSRGIKVEYKVTLINAKENAVSYSGI